MYLRKNHYLNFLNLLLYPLASYCLRMAAMSASMLVPVA